MKKRTPPPLVLDVRPLLQKGGSPCKPIDDAVASLKPGQAFVLRVPFEPYPLYTKLGDAGFSHKSRQMEDSTFQIEFRKTRSSTRAPKSCGCAHAEEAVGEEIRIDARGLQPPEPLMRAMEALSMLPRGKTLVLQTKFKPIPLFGLLENREMAYDCTELPDRTFETKIWHPKDSPS
jgi:uncharacterized protein (DUF2249 family)